MLEELSLESLKETEAGERFEEAVAAIKASLAKDQDIPGARSIVMRLDFKPDARGIINTDIHISANTPKRTIKTLAKFEGGKLKIDTLTNDATQPSLLEGKVEPINRKKEA